MMVSRDSLMTVPADRISLLDPQAVRSWCTELQCTEHQLRAGVYAVGSDPNRIRQYFRRLQLEALTRA